MITQSGLYSIYFEDIEDKYYIGCSSRLELRHKEHLGLLINNNHPNWRLQQAYNQVKVNPIFTILELEEDLDNMFEKEKYWIKEFNSYTQGFNLTEGGKGVLFGEASHLSKLTLEQYKSIVVELAYTDQSSTDISIKLDVPKGVIKAIRSLSTHKYLKNILPKEYLVLESKYVAFMEQKSKLRQPTKIINADGSVFTVINRRQAALGLGLDPSRFSKLMNKHVPIYRGWRLYEG